MSDKLMSIMTKKETSSESHGSLTTCGNTEKLTIWLHF